MQLRLARLCLDCEEVHDNYHCPVCASDQFTYLTRWVPTPERPRQPRPPRPASPELETYRQMLSHDRKPGRGRMLTRALIGLGTAGVLGLFLGGRRARVQGGSSDENSES